LLFEIWYASILDSITKMKWIILAAICIAAASALPEKLPRARAARRGRLRQRAGRQETPDNLYAAPGEAEASPDTGYGAPAAADDALASYGAPAVEEEVAEEVAEYEELPTNELGTSYGAPEGEEEGSGDAADYGDQAADYGDQAAEYDEQPSYAEEEQASYAGDQDAAASEDADALADDAAADPLAMLMKSVPGIPGEDYPIFATAPETEFSCEGQVNGGYYADPDAQCQAFHICSANAEGGLAKYTFLCPNGTIFNQEYFICDWWFNVDCDEAAALAESRNAEIAGEREAADARLAEENLAADESAVIDTYGAGAEEEAPVSSYGAALDEAASESLPSYAEQPSYQGRRRRF
jgi:hypothetical protein